MDGRPVGEQVPSSHHNLSLRMTVVFIAYACRDGHSQITATYMARLGLKVDLSDSAPAAALALRHARGVPGE